MGRVGRSGVSAHDPIPPCLTLPAGAENAMHIGLPKRSYGCSRTRQICSCIWKSDIILQEEMRTRASSHMGDGQDDSLWTEK